MSLCEQNPWCCLPSSLARLWLCRCTWRRGVCSRGPKTWASSSARPPSTGPAWSSRGRCTAAGGSVTLPTLTTSRATSGRLVLKMILFALCSIIDLYLYFFSVCVIFLNCCRTYSNFANIWMHLTQINCSWTTAVVVCCRLLRLFNISLHGQSENCGNIPTVFRTWCTFMSIERQVNVLNAKTSTAFHTYNILKHEAGRRMFKTSNWTCNFLRSFKIKAHSNVLIIITSSFYLLSTFSQFT